MHYSMNTLSAIIASELLVQDYHLFDGNGTENDTITVIKCGLLMEKLMEEICIIFKTYETSEIKNTSIKMMKRRIIAHENLRRIQEALLLKW